MDKKIVIIGGGIAGLSAGCYARMNGYDTEIYEMHSLPGGFCTAWKRNGYVFDGCIHWLFGSGPAQPFYKYWEELGAIQNRRIFNADVFFRFIGQDGRILNFYADVDRLEKHLKEFSPQDSESSEELCRLIRTISKMKIDMDKPAELYNIKDFLKMMHDIKPMMKEFLYCSSISVSDFAQKFKDPMIRECLPKLISPDTILSGLVMNLAAQNTKSAGFPEGGSLEFAKAIEKRFSALGGRIFYNKRVEKILVKNNKACGIRLDDGTEIPADIVVSAGDVKTVLEKMLDRRYKTQKLDYLFSEVPTYSTGLQVSLGLKNDFSAESDTVGTRFKLDKPMEIAGEKKEWLHFKNYNFDKTMAPAGKTFVMSLITSDFNYWKKLRQDTAAYNKEKESIAELVINELDKKYPGFRSSVETIDVATPVTYERYTGSWKGAYMTWKMMPQNSRLLQSIPKQIKGLKNFYLAGMWVMSPGGLPSAVKTGRDVVQIICRKDRNIFKTTKP